MDFRKHSIIIMAQKAEITKGRIGLLEIDGLKSEDGSYFVGIPQVADLTKTSTNTASRDFKRLLGKGFKTSKYI